MLGFLPFLIPFDRNYIFLPSFQVSNLPLSIVISFLGDLATVLWGNITFRAHNSLFSRARHAIPPPVGSGTLRALLAIHFLAKQSCHRTFMPRGAHFSTFIVRIFFAHYPSAFPRLRFRLRISWPPYHLGPTTPLFFKASLPRLLCPTNCYLKPFAGVGVSLQRSRGRVCLTPLPCQHTLFFLTPSCCCFFF